MVLVIETYPSVINLPRVESEPIENISNIPDLLFDQGERLKRQEEWFKDVEEKILYGTKLKPESNIKKLKDATIYENELIDYWELTQTDRSSVFWDRKKDGQHNEFAQTFRYGEYNEKTKIIPFREILDDNYGQNKKRNDAIKKIRNKYLRTHKTSRGNYEYLGNYFYKSQHDKELFLKEVEDLGFVRYADRKKCTVEIKTFSDMITLTSNELAAYSNQYEEDFMI
jgi:hypothetical protein